MINRAPTATSTPDGPRLQPGPAPVSTGEAEAEVLEHLVHDAFLGLVESSAFPCLGSKAVIHRDAYRYGLFPELGTPESAVLVGAALTAAMAELDDEDLRSYVAFFAEPASLDEAGFETLLWRQLQHMHDQDSGPWDPTVASDPESAHFSFSIAGRAYFVVGLHPGSARWARRFAWPTLVFNPHDQFEELRQSGRFETMQSRIRERDEALQGTANPAVETFGESSEARQYSGRAVDPDWRCPLDVREH